MEDHRGKRFVEADFSGAEFRSVVLANVKVTNAWLVNVELSGMISGLSVNGVDVTQFVERSLDERHPERRLLAPTDPDGMRTAWDTIEAFAAATLERARCLPEQWLDESVDGEWSYLETLRHLVYATDRWLTGPVFRAKEPFHPLGMPNPPHTEVRPGVFELDARPDLEEVLAARQGRLDAIRAYLETVTMNDLGDLVGSPNGGTTQVRSCFHVVFREEWWHDQYANRDLAVLEKRVETRSSRP